VDLGKYRAARVFRTSESVMADFRAGHGNHRSIAAVMVVGGGIGGMRAALELADSGLKVFLIEHTPGLGGRVAQLGYMFPHE
jgi:heterodisulfide reductase subunit A-like polyferredoxin